MGVKRWCILVAAFGALSLRAGADDAKVRTKLDIEYFQCIRPAEPKCIGFTEDEVKRCPHCTEWGHYQVYRPIEGSLSDSYYVSHQNTATRFVRDVLVGFYDLSDIQAARYTPPTVRALYDNPKKFGWIEIPSPHAGSIALDRHVVAFALTDMPPPRRRGPITFRRVVHDPSIVLNVIYPSAASGGEIVTSEGRYLFRDTPKFLLPDFVIGATTPEAAGAAPLGWNTWFEKWPGPTYRPVVALQPNTTYNLMVHLSPFGYDNAVTAVPARPEVVKRISFMITQTAASAMRLTALALPDETFLRARNATSQAVVNLDRMRDWKRAPARPKSDPLNYLADRKEPNFVFGEFSFTVDTREREGRTLMGVSIWDENAWPIDEITIPVCIAASPDRASTVCSGSTPVTSDVASFDVARPVRVRKPDAALHIISIDHSTLTGVFHRNDVRGSQYFAWRIPGTEAEFMQRVEASLAQAAEARYTQRELTRAGESLYDDLFASDDAANASAHRAQTAFESFARPYLLGSGGKGKTPSLFVRFVAGGGGSSAPTRLLPIGLAKARLGDDAFLGFHFRIEMPLAHESPAASSTCISRWSMFVPPADDTPLGAARKRLDVRLPAWTHAAKLYENADDFRSWIGEPTDDGEATALAVLAHYGTLHGRGQITMRPHESVATNEFRRRFVRPSVAILDGCETGGEGEFSAESIANVLNEHGVDTIVATTHAITAEMAVDYLGCLATQFAAGAASFGDTHFKALQCLRNRQSSAGTAYGAAALAYELIGDPDIMVCSPKSQ